MLQDLSYGRLENEYKHISPTDTDIIMCFKNKNVLMYKDAHDVTYPKYSEVSSSSGGNFRYAFTIHDQKYFLYVGGEIKFNGVHVTLIFSGIITFFNFLQPLNIDEL